jgi:hypothetical protein
MKLLLSNLKKSKLFQRVIKLGLIYVALEVMVAIGAIFFVAQKVIN